MILNLSGCYVEASPFRTKRGILSSILEISPCGRDDGRYCLEFILIGLLGLGAMSMRLQRNRKFLFAALMVIGLAMAYAGCVKQDTVGEKQDSSLFVRIAQVNKDGGKSYSKVVKVNQ